MAKPKDRAQGEPRALPLTKKQLGFVAEYIRNGHNATAAYRDVYSTGNMGENTIQREACELLKNPKIQDHLVVIQERVNHKVTTSLQVDASWVIENLMLNAEKARNADDFTASNRALELLGKTKVVNAFVDKAKDPENGSGVTINLVSLAKEPVEKPAIRAINHLKTKRHP